MGWFIEEQCRWRQDEIQWSSLMWYNFILRVKVMSAILRMQFFAEIDVVFYTWLGLLNHKMCAHVHTEHNPSHAEKFESFLYQYRCLQYTNCRIS